MELVKTKETNDMNYQPLDCKDLQPMTDFILVAWELCQEKIKLGKFVLARPDTHRKLHYTGTVIACGPDVDEIIQPGQRIIFDQFSDFEKYWDETYGRVALLQESRQGALFAIIPARMEVVGGEGDFNYEV